MTKIPSSGRAGKRTDLRPNERAAVEVNVENPVAGLAGHEERSELRRVGSLDIDRERRPIEAFDRIGAAAEIERS
ncbi:MAG TPA: hypothetical protein VGK95_05205 [Caldimonas sp.]